MQPISFPGMADPASVYAVVVAGGEFPPSDWARPRLERARYVVAADSGLRLCLDCGTLPQALVGDLDSLDPEEVAALPELAWGVHRYPAHKDQSDLQLALELLSRHWQGPVEILAALGGRLDHALFNLVSILDLAGHLGLEARIRNPGTLVMPLRAEMELLDLSGATCSILPLSPGLEDMTLTGFRYPLHRESLSRSQTRGLSNVVESSRARLQLGQGEGLLVLTFPPEGEAC